MSCCGRRDALGSAGFVVTVAGGVVGGDGEGARVARDFEAIAAVGGIDAHLLRGIGGGPYLRGGDDGTLGRVGGAGRGDDGAFHGGGVGCSRGSSAAAAGRGTGGQQRRYGQYRQEL